MAEYFEFEVSLVGVEPRMWRRFQLPTAASFADLHDAIQDACGWTNSHLFQFTDMSSRVQIAVSEYFTEADAPTADDVPLSSHFGRKRKCLYQYDFGDCWYHVVELKRKAALPDSFRRRLVDGERSFPPEDCGGTWGYEECCYAVTISDAELLKLDAFAKEEVVERRAWLGGWRPDAFDLKAAKREFDQ